MKSNEDRNETSLCETKRPVEASRSACESSWPSASRSSSSGCSSPSSSRRSPPHALRQGDAQAPGRRPRPSAPPSPRRQSREKTLLDAVGSVAAGRGRRRQQRRRPASCRAIHFESGAMVKRGPGPRRARHQRRARAARLARRRAGTWRPSTRRRARAAGREATRSHQAQLDTDEAQLKTSSADVSALAAQIERKIVARAVRRAPRHPPGQPRAVPEPGHARSPSLEAIDAVSTSTSRCRSSSLGDVKVGHAACASSSTGSTAPALTGDDRRRRSRASTRATRAIKLRASVPQRRRDELRPGMFVNVAVVLPEQDERRDRSRRRRSCTPRTATRSSSSRTRRTRRASR